ncbi:thioredoxin family protein [candidate division KSB1 bacterium]|nr:thioredoxin family protein [candidate division KSB1 bacterium]
MKMIKAMILCLAIVSGCQSEADKAENKPDHQRSGAKITFIELGSVNCIPCKAMQPVMKAIEEKYGDQVKVLFYDVWTPEQQKYAREYRIKLIPTQVFLNEKGEEILRHEGFFPENEIDAFLRKQGLKPDEKKSS